MTNAHEMSIAIASRWPELAQALGAAREAVEQRLTTLLRKRSLICSPLARSRTQR
jgi:hypothetical protein